MGVRLIELPRDLPALADLITESFRYPENEAWSVQADEKEQLVDAIANLRRIWPLVRLIQALSPSLRDLFRGYVWEEDGQPVGITMVQRRGSTDVWIVGTVAVLPAYRRRGIARKLVEMALDLIRERCGRKAILSVIDGNLPAYTLYEKLGFEHYGGHIEFNIILESAPPEPALPGAYTLLPLRRFDWQPRYELEQRIMPPEMLKYEPVEVGRFREPFMSRLLRPLIDLAQGMRDTDYLVRSAEGKVAARAGYTLPTRGQGLNHLRVRLDPAHAELAPFLMSFLLHKAETSNPGRRVDISVHRWMAPVVAAAEDAGFQRRMEHCRMGVEL